MHTFARVQSSDMQIRKHIHFMCGSFPKELEWCKKKKKRLCVTEMWQTGKWLQVGVCVFNLHFFWIHKKNSIVVPQVWVFLGFGFCCGQKLSLSSFAAMYFDQWSQTLQTSLVLPLQHEFRIPPSPTVKLAIMNNIKQLNKQHSAFKIRFSWNNPNLVTGVANYLSLNLQFNGLKLSTVMSRMSHHCPVHYTQDLTSNSLLYCLTANCLPKVFLKISLIVTACRKHLMIWIISLSKYTLCVQMIHRRICNPGEGRPVNV